MSRINTNVPSLVAQQRLGRNNSDLQTSLARLSTGLRINSAKDDPAGLIASENLRRDITAVNKAISNSERASQLIATSEGALGQVSNLLNDIRGLVTEAANSGALSDDQIAANQLQVDSSLEAIDRISQVTTFQGNRLLDGSLDFITEAGAGFSTVNNLTIEQANFGAATQIDVSVDITSAATQALITAGAGGDPLLDDVTFRITGETGSEVFSFTTGATYSAIADAINLVSDATGVEAAVGGGGALELTSTGYGSDAVVDVEVITEGGLGVFAASLSSTREVGTDIVATINGIKATGKGNDLSLNTSTLDLSFSVDAGSSTDVDFSITGGGAIFQLGGDVVSNQQARLGVGSIATAKLGGTTGRLYELRSGNDRDLSTDTTGAAAIVDEVIDKISGLRGRLGAFERTTLETNILSLQDTVTNLTEAESSIRDADFAAESAALTRAQILVQSGTSVLAIANQNPQNVLALLG